MKTADLMVKHGNWLFRYRSYLPLLILVFALASMWFNRNMYMTRQGWFDFLCLAIAAGGEIVRIIAVGYAANRTSGRNTTSQVAEEINRTGIYSLVRHPLYIGNFLIWMGIALFCRIWWLTAIFVLLYWLYYERIILAEEAFLTGKFGSAYADYAAGVNALLPRTWKTLPNKYYFRWKKVLRQENPSVYSTTLAFVLLRLYQSLISGQSLLAARGWLIGGGIFSLIYLILLALKKSTLILKNEPQRQKITHEE